MIISLQPEKDFKFDIQQKKSRIITKIRFLLTN